MARKKIINVPGSFKFEGGEKINFGNMGDLGSSLAGELSILFDFLSWNDSDVTGYTLSSNNASGTYMLNMINPTGTGGGKGKLGFAFRDESAKELWVNTNKKYNDRKWHNSAFCKGALNTLADTELYMDAVSDKYNKKATGFSDPANFSRGVALGASNGTAPTGYLDNMMIGRVLVYKRKLTLAEVTAYVNEGTIPTGAFASWFGKENGGLTVADEQGNHDGTLSSWGMWSLESIGRGRVYDFFADYPSAYDADNTKIARSNLYDITATGGAVNTGNSNTAEWDWLMAGNSDRQRQAGNVVSFKANFPDLSKIVTLKITQWRKDANGYYDLVQVSEDVIPSMVAGALSTHEFTTPFITEEGDYFGFRLKQTQNSHTFRSTTGLGFSHGLRYSSSLLSETGAAWGSQSVAWQIAVEFELYIESPQAAYVGNSVMAGHNVHFSFLESSSAYNPTKVIPYLLTTLLSGNGPMATYQNMGIGGQTTTQILARFDQDVINLYPRVVFMEGGLNDYYTAGYDQAAVIANITAMFDKCVASETIAKVYMLGDIPYNTSTTEEARDLDALNIAVQTLCKSYNIVEFVSATAFLGKIKSGGDAGNRWSLPNVFADATDSIHLNEEGNKVYADSIYKQITS